MKLKLLLLSALCASAVNLYADPHPPITSGTIFESNGNYTDTDTQSALTVTGSNSAYSGTNTTLTATRDGNYSNPGPGHGADITDHATLTLAGGNITTTGQYGFGVYTNSSTLTLTGGTITNNSLNGYGLYLTGTSSFTGSNVNIESKGQSANGMLVVGSSTLTMTGGTITTDGLFSRGIAIGTATGTVSNVSIETKGEYTYGVTLASDSTLTLTDSTITTGSSWASGIALENSTATLNNVNIKNKGMGSYGVQFNYSTLTMTDGTITNDSTSSYGFYLSNESTGTISNVNINTTGESSNGVYANHSATLTLTDCDITATGDSSNSLYIGWYSIGTVSLNHNTLTGGITAEASSTLNLTGSNGTVINGDINARADDYEQYIDGSTINITLNGAETQLIGNATHDATSTININIENGTQLNQLTGNINTLTLQNGATLSTDNNNGPLLLNGAAITVTPDQLTLSDGTILDYNDNALTLTGTLTIGEGILIDLSALTETGLYTVLNWSEATVTGGTITDANFTNTTAGVEGTFTVANNQLTFNATAVP
jgi:hypothetical protein